MDEVPASPELVKKRKSRRTALHLSKQRTPASLNRARAGEVHPQDSVVEDETVDASGLDETVGAANVEPETPKQNNLLYFDVDTENVELAFEDPLVSAAISERANQIEQESIARPSSDFLANVQNKFVKIDEVIDLEARPVRVDSITVVGKEPNATTAPSKKANYSYTQFDLDTQMIGICEAADILAGLNTNPEQELNDWSSPLKQQQQKKDEHTVHLKTEPRSQQIWPETPNGGEVRKRDRWSNVRQSSLSRKSIPVQECRTPPSTSEIDVSRCITVDFSDESDNELKIDFSKIKSSQLRRRLEKIQSYIDSPPQAVRKTAERRTFSRKKIEKSPHTPAAVRRLSYESAYSERTNAIEMDPAHMSSEEEMDCLHDTQQHPQPKDPAAVDSGPEGDNFDSSLLIKANINQLSQFFSQSGAPVTKQNPDSESLNKEPSFFGFPPEPTSPISLPSDPGASPKVLNIAWLFRNEPETESETEFEGRSSEEQIQRLLEDDDDFLVQLYSSQRKEESHDIPEPLNCGSPAREAEFVMPLPPAEIYSDRTNIVTHSNEANKHTYPSLEGFQTARGREIQISEKARAKARAIWDDEERKFDADKAWQTNTTNDNETCAVLVSAPEQPSFGGFCTAGGNKVHVSDKALARAEQLWKEEEANDGIVDAPVMEQDKPQTALPFFDGFQTAGGSRVRASEKALARALNILDQLEHEMKTEDIPPENEQGFGFQTARGSTVKVSDGALSKAQSILRRIELDLENEFNDPSNEKTGAIPQTNEIKPNTAEDGHCVKRLRDTNDNEPETPLKKYKPERRCNNAVHQFSTSTPNIHCKATIPTSHINSKHELEHFFGDLDDHEFQQLFSGMEQTGPNNRRVRPMKQVRLTNRFDECENVSTEDHNLPGGIPWDDSFGDVVTKLNSDEGLKVAKEIAEARKLCRQRQQRYIENKPMDERRPRLTEFIRKKQMSGRNTLRQFVNGNKTSGDICVIPERLRHVNVDNAMDFKFDMVQLYGKTECLENVEGISLGDQSATTCLIFNDRCQVGLPEFKAAFLASPGVDPALIPTGWVENCWVWIIVKLASMECTFPECFSGLTTPEAVLNQLMYRYHIEIDSAKRSVIRKILEKDDIASKRMVLFVSRIFRGSVPFEVEIELCDGWYAIRTTLDFPLIQAILRSRVTIGTKLMIQGAELINLSEGCSPLEIPADVRLKIHANSTRRTKWDTRLGLYKVPLNFVISCNDVLEGGGLTGSLEVRILRVYPMMFVDKTQRDAQGPVKGDRSSTVLRSERVERRRALESDSSRFENLQALFSQVQREVQAESGQQNSRSSLLSKLTRATTTAELLELVDAGLDLSCIEIEFSSTQREAIIDHQRRKQEECLLEVNRRIKERMQCGDVKRKVSSLLKLRITDVRKPDKVLLLSIWRPPEDHCDMFQEGRVLEIRNASANGIKNGEVQLTAGKMSSFKTLDLLQYEPPVRLMRTLTKISDIDISGFRPMFSEFDTIGIVIQVETLGNKNFQTVYLADIDMNLLGVHFWSSIKAYAYEDIVKEHAVLCISNLQWRTNNAYNVVPTAFATEYTTFSEHSKSKHFIEEFQIAHTFLKDRNLEEFYEKCKAKIAELKDKKLPRSSSFHTPLRNNSTTTPMRSILTSVNPNATTTPSPGAGQPASLQKRKLEQLAAYRSPPKLSPIIMRYNSKVRKDFKTPSKLEDRINQIDRDDSVC